MDAHQWCLENKCLNKWYPVISTLYWGELFLVCAWSGYTIGQHDFKIDCFWGVHVHISALWSFSSWWEVELVLQQSVYTVLYGPLFQWYSARPYGKLNWPNYFIAKLSVKCASWYGVQELLWLLKTATFKFCLRDVLCISAWRFCKVYIRVKYLNLYLWPLLPLKYI